MKLPVIEIPAILITAGKLESDYSPSKCVICLRRESLKERNETPLV